MGLRKMTTGDADWLTVAERAATSGLPARKEAHLRFAMGKYFDDIEDFGRAMECFRRANELTRSLRPRHDRERLSRFVDRIIDVCDGQWMALHRRHTMPDSARAAFIVGMPRSGTTLAEHILASHPAVFGAGELPFWGRHSAQFDLSGHAGTGIAALAHAYLELLAGLSADARRVVDKMPDNFLSLGLIHAALPEARILHMRRNPLDTCLSIYFQDFEAGYTYANDLEDLSHYYRQYERVMNHWRSVLPPGVILDVSYEELVDQPEASSRRMIDFIGLPWDAQCLEFQRTRRTVTTVSQWRVRQKIDRSSIERWRHYEPFIAPLMGLQTGDVGSAAA